MSKIPNRGLCGLIIESLVFGILLEFGICYLGFN